jgi:hypothetical protein
MNDLKDIKARLDAAAPGPWRALSGKTQRSPTTGSPVVYPLVLANNEYVLGELSPWVSDAERDLIVNSRDDIERLYEAVRRTREHLRAVVAGGGREDGTCAAARAYLQSVEKP